MKDPIKEFQGDFRFLSNFAPSPIQYEGETYATAEHLFQALKAVSEEDHEKVRKAVHAGAAKKLGKLIERREDWEEVKDEMMRMVVRLKFAQNPDLAEKLLATEDRELQEGNWWNDAYWGVSLKTGHGLNKLGKILEETRSNLRVNSLTDSMLGLDRG